MAVGFTLTALRCLPTQPFAIAVVAWEVRYCLLINHPGAARVERDFEATGVVVVDCTGSQNLGGGALFLVQGGRQTLDCCLFARCRAPVIFLYGADYAPTLANNFSMSKSSFYDCPAAAAGYPSLIWQSNSFV